MDRKIETKTVKKALESAGYLAKVHHGNGTAWGWLTVSLDIPRHDDCSCGSPDEYGRRETCDNCKDKWRKTDASILEIVKRVTGRHQPVEYDGNIQIQLGFV